MNNIVEHPDGFGNVLIIRSKWRPQFSEYVKTHDIRVIRFSQYGGWNQSEISCVLQVPGIEGVEIFSKNPIDASAVEHLTNLRLLILCCPSMEVIDLSKLWKLEQLGLDWSASIHGVSSLKNLRSINISDYPFEDLSPLRFHPVLRSLVITSKKLQSLAGLASLRTLNTLKLYGCRKLVGLGELNDAGSLEKLHFLKCTRIASLAPLAGLKRLKELIAEDCGELESIAPVAACKELEWLQISGSSSFVDGDMRSLLEMKRLKRVLIVPKKHYNLTDDMIEKRLEIL